eukprot:scaffold239712_cov17-Tisochrysis_lutea.AAC.1
MQKQRLNVSANAKAKAHVFEGPMCLHMQKQRRNVSARLNVSANAKAKAECAWGLLPWTVFLNSPPSPLWSK